MHNTNHPQQQQQHYGGQQQPYGGQQQGYVGQQQQLYGQQPQQQPPPPQGYGYQQNISYQQPPAPPMQQQEQYYNTPPPPMQNPAPYQHNAGTSDSTTYQGYVAGLSGWNDPPQNHLQKQASAEQVLEGIDSPAGLVVGFLERALDEVSQAIQPSQKRMLQDTEKRVTVLFDTLAAKGDDFPRTTLALLVSLVKNMEARAWPDADAVVMRMLKDLSVDDNRWVMGVKRLSELYARNIQARH
ncbi:MAG: hypothetical protein SGCHY_005475 [Lobulomycetales sp.]